LRDAVKVHLLKDLCADNATCLERATRWKVFLEKTAGARGRTESAGSGHPLLGREEEPQSILGRQFHTSNVCVFITAVPNTKLCAWGEEDSGGHVP
jgi:hypothetical protein